MLEEDYRNWKASPVTQELLRDLAAAGEASALGILNRRISDPYDDQYLKGYIFGISEAAGWKPKLIDSEGEEVPDEV